MKRVLPCPLCGGARLAAYAWTPEAERNGCLHFAQSRCRDCDLVFSDPVADEEELERFYRQEYYEEHERVFNAFDPRIGERIRARAAGEAEGLKRSVLPYVSGGRFFEIGAGYGALLAGARALGFSVAGVEPSARAAAFARDVMGLDEVRDGLFRADAWPPASFDVVYSFQVIEHVADLHAFAADMVRLLKPGGLAVIGTENHHNAWVGLRRLRSWLKGRRVPEFQTASHHTYYFSDRSLRTLLERHGLAIERCQVYTPSLAEKLPQYRFRRWYSQAAFYALHYADAWAGRGGRVLVWCRKPPAAGVRAA